MRFLFGIITGAVLTLLVATTTDAPTNPVVNTITSLWERLIDATSDRLFAQHSKVPTLPKELLPKEVLPEEVFPEEVLTKKVETNDDLSKDILAKELLEDRTEPATATASMMDVAATPATPSLPPFEARGNTETEPEAAAPDLSVAPDLLPEGHADAAFDTQVATVWVPFHSERSASGFADTLSRHFDYPFDVRRNGPGAYQVTFSYADLAQRENLLLEISELTGQ